MSHIDAYHFYEREWDSYEELQETFEWDVPDEFNIAEYVCDRWTDERGRVAIFADDSSGDRRTYTFRDVELEANRLANHLSAAGVSRGDRIGICLGQRPEAAVAHVAAWKLGAVSVPLSTQFGEDALGYRLDDCSATACVVGAESVETLRSLRDDLDALASVVTVDVDGDGDGDGDGDDDVDTGADVGTGADASSGADETTWTEMAETASRDFETVTTDAEDDAIIIYTSGTTGQPKGVLHAHRMLLGNLPLFAENFLERGTTSGTVFWTPVEWSWIGSLFSIVMAALFYGRPVVAYDADRFDAEAAFELIERHRITNVGSPPTALRMMMQVEDVADRYDLSSVRSVGAGGEAVGESLVDWVETTFDDPSFEESYGQTEANLVVGDCSALAERRPGKIGLAGPGHELTVVDPETAEPIEEPGEVGELAVRYEGNPVCFVEYWNKPEQTDRKVRNGWLLTEDLGTIDEEGYVSFEGRADDVIITSGYRVSPEEIEEAIASHDAVAAAGVIGVPDDERGTVPKAFVVLSGEEPTDGLRETLESRVKERLAPYEYPRSIEFVEALPKTSTGKVRRETLREREGLDD